MPRILIIERSATLRHLLSKLLLNSGFQVHDAETFEEGLHQVLDTLHFDAIVVGWPKYSQPSSDELFARLESPPHADRTLLVMAHEEEQSVLSYAAHRPGTGWLHWDKFRNAPLSLSKLMAMGRAEKGSLPTPDSDKIRVLFVDDSPSIRVYYRRILQQHGYNVETACSVKEGLDKALHLPIDIAIIDYFMPGENGHILCRALASDPRTSEITSAIFTGTYLDAVIKDSLEGGAVECMFKNEATELFLARIAAMSRTVRARKSIDSERQRLDGILSSVGEGVYGINTEGVITFINPAAQRILGYSVDDDFIGLPAKVLFYSAPDSSAPLDAEDSEAGKASPHSWEAVFRHRDGYHVPVACTLFPLRIQNKREGSVVAFRDISEQKRLENELRWQATHDPSTKLLNRRRFEECLREEVSRLQRSVEMDALLYIDLDRFKYVNDTAGHAAGDQLLVEISEYLKARLRGADILARIGGDEFAIILRNVDTQNALIAADAFLDVLSSYTFGYAGKNYKIGGSIGVAMISNETSSAGEVLANADIACYMAKRKGRNQIHVYSVEDSERHVMDLDVGWSERLRNALRESRFVLHFQPIVPMADVDTHDLIDSDNSMVWQRLIKKAVQCRCYEVLVRLVSAEGEIISPNAFISTAERFNLMIEIDRWVVSHALRALSEMAVGRTDMILSINLSGQTLADEGFVPFVKQTITTWNIEPQSLIFEVTETSAISNIDTVRRIITELRALGCRFALDDFGTGFSSFSHLKYLPVDYIKIDGLFVRDMAKDPSDLTIVKSINDIAHSLGRKTIAEYVESADILRLLKECGVDYVQGNYISEPLVMPHDERVTLRLPIAIPA